MSKKIKLSISNMENIIKIMFFIVLFSILLHANEMKMESAPQASKNDFTQIEKEYLKTKKSIKMCIDPRWMPFEAFDENDHHIGMSADFFKIFQKNLGVEIVPVITKTWSESLILAKERKCDILSCAMSTPQRKEYMNFTTDYLNIPLVIATRQDVTYINRVKQLGNHKIGIVRGYAFNELMREKYPSLNIINVKDIDEGLHKVADGELFGFIGTIASIGYKFQRKLIGELKISGKFDEQWKLGVGVRNDDDILLGIFQKAINNLTFEQKQKS